jgi:cytochrome c oxidase subunit 4
MTLILIWAALVLLLILEVVSALLHAGWVAYGLAPIMVLLVAGGFMHVLRGSQLTRIFAAAGVFWLLILVGLGGIDFFARRDYPAPLLSRSSVSEPSFGGSGEPGYNLPGSHFTAPRH